MATATKPRKKKITLQPLGDRVVVEREESLDTTAGGIVLPDSAQEKPQEGRILSRLQLFGEDEDVYSHPAMVGRLLYVRGNSSILCVSLEEASS